MKKLLTILALIFTASVLLIACGGGEGGGAETNGAGAPTKNYFPVAVSDKWTYRMNDNNFISYLTSEITQGGGNTYTNKTTFSGSTSYTINDLTLSNNNAWVMSKLTTYDASGVSQGTMTWSPPRIAFPSKTDIGTHEIQTSTCSNGTFNTQETVDITFDGYESVIVPAGTFNKALKLTYKVTAYGNTTAFTEWFADGVGCVKSIGPSYTQELTSYTIK